MLDGTKVPDLIRERDEALVEVERLRGAVVAVEGLADEWERDGEAGERFCALYLRAALASSAVERGGDSSRAEVEQLLSAVKAAMSRAESIEPQGSPDWVESGRAMRTTVLRTIREALPAPVDADA